MVVTENELTLLDQRVGFLSADDFPFDVTDQLFHLDASSRIQVSLVVDRQSFQAGENSSRCGACTGEVFFFDGVLQLSLALCIVAFFLDFFEHGEKPSVPIGGVSVGFV